MWEQNCCECVIRISSNGNSNSILNGRDGTYDIGLFHINTYNWAYCNNGKPPCSIEENINCAKYVYKAGRYSWLFWTAGYLCGCVQDDTQAIYE